MPTEMYVTPNTSYSEVLDYAAKEHIDNAALNQLLWGVLDYKGHKAKRTFAYAEPLAATETDCAPAFVRTFVHIDWIDGESVVQAEETSIEAGFNNRFHKIEADFDAMKVDVKKLFDCLAELRHDLAARLEEIRLEFNRVNTDIADCCNNDTGGVVPWHPYDPRDDYYPVYPHYPVPGYPYPGTNPVGPGGNPVGPWVNPGDRYSRYAYDTRRPGPHEVIKPWVTDTTPFEVDGGDILRSTSDPNIAIISGMRGRRISTDTFNGNPVEVWSTPAGVVMTPADAAALKGTKVGWTNPHVEGAGTVLGWAMANEEKVKERFGGRGFTVQQFNDAFGEERLAGGKQLKTYLEQLPSGTQVKSGVQAAGLVMDRAVANVLRDRSADETVIGMAGLNAEGTAGKVGVGAMRSVPARAATELNRAGIATVADLAKADPAKLGEIGGVSLDTAAGWSAEANALSALLGPGRG